MEFAITHSSTACTLLEIGPFRILTDPVLDPGEGEEYNLGLRATRYRAPELTAKELRPLDLALLSHARHADNLDTAGRQILRDIPQVITTPDSGKFLEENFIRSQFTGLGRWDQTTVLKTDPATGDHKQIKITATPALHGPWWFPHTDEVCGFIIEWEGQNNGALYISGDTIFFSGIEEIARRFDGMDGRNRIGTAILHLGAVNFWPPLPAGIRFTFNGREGAETARLLGARTVIPIHYAQTEWSHFQESLESYDRAFTAAGFSTDAVKWLNREDPRGQRTVIEI